MSKAAGGNHVPSARCPAAVPNSTKQTDEEKKFRDCADLFQAGFTKNGVYTLYVNVNVLETKKVGRSFWAIYWLNVSGLGESLMFFNSLLGANPLIVRKYLASC